MRHSGSLPIGYASAVLPGLLLFLLGLFWGASSVVYSADTVFEDDFKSYEDFDPAIRNWNFRGVGGEVIDGKYMFTGVTQKQAEYWDVGPDHTTAIVRDFAAGPAVKINAKIKVCPHKFDVFKPGEGENQRFGIVIIDRFFERRKVVNLNEPTIALYLNLSADGKKSITFDYASKKKIAVQSKDVVGASDWKENVEYDLEIILQDGKAVGRIATGGKVIYEKEIASADFANVFAKAYPGFANRRMTGEVLYFKADNLGSQKAGHHEIKVLPLSIPEKWTEVGRKVDVKFEMGKKTDFGKLFGGFTKGKETVLRAELEVPESCFYAVNCQADWWWRLKANRGVVADHLKRGSGHVPVMTLIPLNAGKNTLELTVRSGSGGWNFCFSEADDINKAKTELAKSNVMGSDTLFWNMDRLLDDINNLKRHGMNLADLEKELIGLRRTLSISLDSHEIHKYDPLLDRAYARVYDAYRYVELENAISEFKGLDVDGGNVNRLEKLAVDLKAEILGGKDVEKTALAAQKIIDACRKDLDGMAEGVTRGGSFGRFGWITSHKLGAYSSGDGLLANQVLADGAIARQYNTAVSDPKLNYLVRFDVSGEKDAAANAAIAAMPSIGESVEVQFGYDPAQFYSSKTSDKVKVKDINWIRKKLVYDEKMVIDSNLVAPGMMVESAYNEFVLTDSPSGAFTDIGFLDSGSRIFSASIKEDGVIYDCEVQGKLGANWIVMWNGGDTEKDLTGHIGNIPLQIIFQRQPQKIERIGDKIHISFAKPGALWLNTLYGVKLQPTGNWRGKLPPKAVAKANFFGRSSLAHPVDCREFYRYDTDTERVEIINKYSYRYFDDNDWGIKPVEVSVLPPVLSLMVDKGFDAVLPEDLKDLDYPTIYGPLYGVEGGSITYTLPVPYVPAISIPANVEADENLVSELCRHTRANVEGSKFRMYAERKDRGWCSLSFVANGLSKQWQYLSPVFKEYVNGLFSYNMKASASYRDTRVWRSLVETYSGRKYYFSFSISSGRPGNIGVFGDRGYGVGLHLIQLDHMTNSNGDYDRLRELWRDDAPLASPEAIRDGRTVTVDKMLGYIKNVHDWAWMEDGSNDCGDNGPVVDCSQAPFAGHSARLRMARKIGNAAEIANSAYHLAKGQLSLIGRLPFTDYGHENGVLGIENINTGFRECITPKCFSNSPQHAATKRNEYDGSYVSTMSYAAADDGFDIYFPYSKYIWNDMRKYEDNYQHYYPNNDTDSETHSHLISRLMFLILNGTPLERVQKLYDVMISDLIFYKRDFCERDHLPMLMSGGVPIVLTGWYPLALPEFTFVPAQKKAVVKFKTVPRGYTLHALSSDEPASVTVNGKRVKWERDAQDNRLAIEIPSGNSLTLEIVYDEFDATRFTPLPIPPARRMFPEIQGAIQYDKCRRAQGKLLESFNFKAEPGKNPGVAGDFKFHHWGKSRVEPCGGVTGAKTMPGVPVHALRVMATPDHFTGWISPVMDLPQKLKSVTVVGKVMRSADYSGNEPKLFAWLVSKSKKSKAEFYTIPNRPACKWQKFAFVIPRSKMPVECETMQLNLVSSKNAAAANVSGCVYYKDVEVYFVN